MTNITIIVPVHEFSDNVKSYLIKGFASIKAQKDLTDLPIVLVVYTPAAEQAGLLDFINNYINDAQLPISVVRNDGKSDFASQINLGVKTATTDFISILEYDDEYSIIYFKNVIKHIATYPDVGMFLPFTIETDDKTGNIIQLVNQTIWSKGYVGENGVLGYLNVKSLNEFSFYTIGGSIIKKSEYEAVGGLKSNIKLSFTYEFILRFLENANKIFSMAKFGYKHVINREGALFTKYASTMPMNERKFWFEVAKKECHFFTDRIIDTTPITPKLTVDTPAQQ